MRAFRCRAFALALTASLLAGCGDPKPKGYGVFVRDGSRLSRLEPRVSADGSVISAQGVVLIHERILTQPGAEQGFRVYSRSLIGKNIDLVMAADGQTITQVLTEPAGGSELFGEPIACDLAPVPGEREMITLRARGGWKPGLYAIQPPGEDAAPIPFAVDVAPAALATHPAVGRMDRYFEVRPGGPGNNWNDFLIMSQRGVGGDQRRNGRFILKTYYRPAGALENDARQWRAAADRALTEGRAAPTEADLRRAEGVLGKDASRDAKLAEVRQAQARRQEEERREQVRRAAEARLEQIRKLLAAGQPAVALALAQTTAERFPDAAAGARDLIANAEAALEQFNGRLKEARAAAQERHAQEFAKVLWEGDCMSGRSDGDPYGRISEKPAHARLTPFEFILDRPGKDNAPITVRWALREIRRVNAFTDEPGYGSTRRVPWHALELDTDTAHERLHFPSPEVRQPLFDELKRRFDKLRAEGDKVTDDRHGLERVRVEGGVVVFELTVPPRGWSAVFQLPPLLPSYRLSGADRNAELQVGSGSPRWVELGKWYPTQANSGWPAPGAEMKLRSTDGKERRLTLEMRVE